MYTVSEHHCGIAKNLEGAHTHRTATPFLSSVSREPGLRRELRAWPTLGSLPLVTSCFIIYLNHRPEAQKIPSKNTLLISVPSDTKAKPSLSVPWMHRVPALEHRFFMSYRHSCCTAGPRGCLLCTPFFPEILPFLHNEGVPWR